MVPGGRHGGKVCHLELDQGIGEKETTILARELHLHQHEVSDVTKS